MNPWVRTALVAVLFASSCEGRDHAALDLGLSWQKLARELPSDVARLRVTYTVDGQAPVIREATVDELATTGGERGLTLDVLPAQTSVRVRVEGLNKSGKVAYVGVVGPLALQPGERLAQRVVLTPANKSVALNDEAPPPRVLHSATRLADGRVLIAGGFGAPKAEPCPASLESTARCYALTAREDVWLFDPTTLGFHELPGGLLKARGGHSATALPDGRVLLAGGAQRALLVLETGNHLRLLQAEGEDGQDVSASFELFEASPAGSSSRDPSRGRVVGGIGAPEQPGPLSVPRFLHAAAANPVQGEQVILAGGTGGAHESGTYEVFDARRSGGAGVVFQSLTALDQLRATPSAVALTAGAAGWVWLFGGNRAQNDAALAERWSASGEDAVGTVAPAIESVFPQADASGTASHPEYAFETALVAGLAGGSYALCAASAPPPCDGHGRPLFPATTAHVDSAPCTSDALRACYVVDAATGTTLPCKLTEPHLAGAATALDDGRAALTGGHADQALHSALHVELISVDPDSGAARIDASLPLQSARTMHTTTSLYDGGLLSVGGLVWTHGTPTLVSQAAEILWL